MVLRNKLAEVGDKGFDDSVRPLSRSNAAIRAELGIVLSRGCNPCNAAVRFFVGARDFKS